MNVSMAVSPSPPSMDGAKPEISTALPSSPTLEPVISQAQPVSTPPKVQAPPPQMQTAALTPPPGMQSYVTPPAPAPAPARTATPHNSLTTPPPHITPPLHGPPPAPPAQVTPIPFYRAMTPVPRIATLQNPALHPPGVIASTSAPSPQPQPAQPQPSAQLQPQPQPGVIASNPPNQVLGFDQQAQVPPAPASSSSLVPPGAAAVSVSPVRPPGLFPVTAPQYQTVRPYPQAPNGYSTVPAPGPVPVPVPGPVPSQPPQMMNPAVLGSAPAGMPRYSAPYPSLVRPSFPPRPPVGTMGVMPLPRPPIPGVRVVPPVLKFPPAVTATDPASKGAVQIIASTEKPQTTVYVGKIAPTVENEFLLSLLQLCGPIKSWKRAQDPTNGSPKGFGFCEFESAEGVLRALRLLNKFNLEGQELVLNVNQATREYLERYVEKKVEREKQIKEAELQDADREEETAPGVEKKEPSKPPLIDSVKKEGTDTLDQANQDNGKRFGIVNDADREADEDALQKLTNMLEERSRLKPLPPPPPLHTASDAPGKSVSTSEVPARSKDADSDVEIIKSDIHDDKNEDETTSENKPTSEHERPETSSSDRGRRYDRSRERDRDREIKREKERELERYERERERERVRRERDREMRIWEAERLYEEREREWEARERDRERQRQYEREREKERERERRREIKDQEEESDDEDWRKRRHRSGMYDEKRKRRQREKEDDLFDRLREEQEIAEMKKRKIEDKKQEKDDSKVLNRRQYDGNEFTSMSMDEKFDDKVIPMDQAYGSDSGEGVHHSKSAETALRNGNGSESGDEAAMEPTPGTDSRQNSSAPTRKLGFGLIGSGKRTTVPSVFHQEDDEDTPKEKKMRPLVPIDYSAEELQAVSSTPPSGTASNLAAAAEFAKRISILAPKEERVESEREYKKQSERSVQKGREINHNDDESNRSKEESKERSRERDRSREKNHERDSAMGKSKAVENKKLLDAKQLIDTIPKTKEELFAYNIDWTIYDKHDLHERMRPWISKKITEFLGEEETTLVDFVVSNTQKHVTAAHMLELLESILDDEAEMFVLKMWRMLIFEIKKVETGLASKPKS